MAHNKERVPKARALITQKIPTYIVYVGIIVLIIAGYQGCNNWRIAREEAAKVAKERTGSEQQKKEQQRAVVIQRCILATTPATLTLNYHFYIESDAPVDMMYDGLKKPVRYTPGKGFQQFPTPTGKGPKVFTDPKDPKNGHVSFRIYAMED